jgi:hypothetical protein
MRMPNEVLVLRDLLLSARAAKVGPAIFPLAVCRRQQRTTGRSAGAARLALDRLPKILQGMKSVGDLPDLPRPFTRGLGEQAAAIPTDDTRPQSGLSAN